MSGRKINDFGGLPHTSDMAMSSKSSIKHYQGVEGAGEVDGRYPDTTEDVKRDQMAQVSKVKGNSIKPGQRS